MTNTLNDVATTAGQAPGSDARDSGPLVELTGRLRREMQYGRDAARQQVPMLPAVTRGALAAYRSHSRQN